MIRRIHRDQASWRIALGSLLAFAGLTPSLAMAQPYPVKTIRIVLPYSPGGSSDRHARIIAKRLTARMGQQVIVDNRAGANGAIAMEHVARSAPDGYTLVFALPAQYAVNPALYPKLPYDPLRDFDPVILATRAPLVLFTHPSVPVKTVPELVQLAKARPDALVLASAGNGSAGHLALELFRDLSGTRILHVPYKGAAPSMVDLVAGQTQLSFLAWSTGQPHVATGRLRALGVTSAQRAKVLPDLPAIAEALPGYDIANWYGVSVPHGTPAATIGRLNTEANRVLNEPETRQLFEREAVEPVGGTPEAFADYLKSEHAKWGKLVRASGLKLE